MPMSIIACRIRTGPSSSAIRAVTVFDEWISICGTLSEAPSGWLSLIVKRPATTGAAL